MKLKNKFFSALAGLAMMAAVAGPAAADTLEINIYGASAQYLYWGAEAKGILTSSTYGCPAANVKFADDSSKANGITMTTGCTNSAGHDTVIIRNSSKASYDGPSALLGDDQYANWNSITSGEKCQAGDTGDPGAGTEVNGNGVSMPLRGYYRKMIDESTCGTTWETDPISTHHGDCTGLKCVRVTMGVSDVNPASFTQSSTGNLTGPVNPGAKPTSRVFTGINMSQVGYGSANPIVVPFSFYVNNKVKHCTVSAADSTPLAYTGATCPGYESTLTNMPRMMAVELFSKKIQKWSDFGGDFTPANAIVCLRHAGSGTAATLDYAVMNHNRWGGQLVTTEDTGADGYTVYFNDGSGDEMKCIDGGTYWTGGAAVGYSDSDQAIGTETGSAYPNTVRLTYNGESAGRVAIRNGRYDFFTNEWALWNKQAPQFSKTDPFVQSLLTYAANPANMPSAAGFWGAAKNGYWASSGEMNFNKGTDQKYPTYVGCETGYCSQP